MKMPLVIAVVGGVGLAVSLACGILLYQLTRLRSFEYRVCLVQGSRVTFVNASWQGQKPMEIANPTESMDSCPDKWAYLEKTGEDGWELVAVAPLTNLKDEHAQELYLRRQKR